MAERAALRETHVRPLVTGFFEWARGARQNVEGRNLATKALGYAANCVFRPIRAVVPA